MPAQIHQFSPGQPFDQFAQARPHALQGGDRFEQGEQDFWPHGIPVLA
jgi:hypothetical protein